MPRLSCFWTFLSGVRLLQHPAAQQDGMNIQLVVEQNHVCELSGLERTVIVLDAERTGRICRGRLHGLTERNPHAHRAPDAVHQIGGGTGDRAVVQRGEIAAHGDSLSAE